MNFEISKKFRCVIGKKMAEEIKKELGFIPKDCLVDKLVKKHND